MDSFSRNFIIATVAVTAASAGFIILTSDSFFDNFLALIAVLVVYPCTMAGLYFFLEGRNHRWINGMDWTSMTERERRNAASYVGLFMTIGCIVLCISVPLTLSSFVLGIILIVCSVVVMLVPFLTQEKAKSKQFVERSAGRKAMIFIAVSVIAIVPTVGVGMLGFSTETVEVEFLDTQIHVRAPMFDYTFDYDTIEDLEMDPDFDKGSRVAGYGTPTISSGTFNNAQFGNYKLASYTQVDPCIFFLYEGKYYAFNQSDDLLTQQVYDRLSGLVG